MEYVIVSIQIYMIISIIISICLVGYSTYRCRDMYESAFQFFEITIRALIWLVVLWPSQIRTFLKEVNKNE